MNVEDVYDDTEKIYTSAVAQYRPKVMNEYE